MIRSKLMALLVLLATGCNLNLQPLLPTPTPITTATANPNVWQQVDTGLEQRTYVPPESPIAQMVTVRVDPAQVTFRVHYRPREPLTLSEWRALLPDAAVIVNAGYFDTDFRAQGLLITDGVVYGRSYVNNGGTFAVQEGLPLVRSNLVQPYLGEAFTQAIQGFPNLVTHGDQAFYNTRQTRRSRRTVIGQDAGGRILIMATPGIGLGLYDLSAYLNDIDANLVNAFNLDGGGSTMLYIRGSDYNLPSIDAVPAILAIYN